MRIKRMSIISAILMSTYIFAENKSIECPTEQKIASCVTSMGFTYRVPPVNRKIQECEQGWYYPNGTFIVDPGNASSSERVVDVTPKNLTMSTCENLQWQIDCHDPVWHCKVNFTVSEQDKSATSGDTDPNVGISLGLIKVVAVTVAIAVVAGLLGILTIIWKCNSKRQGSNARRQNGVV